MADSVDDLEYHLKFPQSPPKDLVDNKEKDKEKDKEKENDGFVFVYNEEKLPVVVLFGWAGCMDKYLAKYSEVYEERGCITLRCVVPPMVTFLRHDKLPHLARKILDLLHEMSLDEHPIFFHIFSNGGAFFYQYVSLEIQKEERMLQVKGAIFDSAPGERRFFSIFRAMTAIMGGSNWVNTPGSFIITVLLFLGFMLYAYLKGLFEGKKPRTDPIMLEDEPFTWPQLFIYSTNDELVFSEDIEKFAKKREKKGVKVERLCLDRSRHVKHLIYHKEVYINTVMSFLQDCLKDNIFAK